MTLEEWADSVSIDLPKWQRDKNLAWCQTIHSRLNEGGICFSPVWMRAWQKNGDGVTEITDVFLANSNDQQKH